MRPPSLSGLGDGVAERGTSAVSGGRHVADRAARTRPVVVEVIGPAGAGKSSLVRDLCARDAGFHRGRSLRRADLPLVARRARRWAPILARLAFAAPHQARQYARHLVRVEAIDALLPSAARADVPIVLFDEGPVFSMALMLAFDERAPGTGPVASHVARAADRWAAILDALIWLDADDAALTSRIRARAKAHRIKEAGPESARTFLDRYRRAYETIGRRLADAGVDILRVDTAAAPIVTVASDVAMKLEGLRHAR